MAWVAFDNDNTEDITSLGFYPKLTGLLGFLGPPTGLASSAILETSVCVFVFVSFKCVLPTLQHVVNIIIILKACGSQHNCNI